MTARDAGHDPAGRTGSIDGVLASRLLAESPDGLLLVTANGIIDFANRVAHVMFGFDDGLVGLSVDVLVPPEHREHHAAHRQGFARDPRQRPMGTDLKLFAQHRDGNMFPVEISLSPITIDDAVHTVATVRDVSERQESRARLMLHEERERIAVDLYDAIIQRLFAAGMSLQSVTNLIDSAVARDRVVAVTDELDELVRSVRSAIFSIGVRDSSQSLASQIGSLVAERSRGLGFTPDLVIDGSLEGLPEFVAAQLVATLTEAISNVARHADATDVWIRVERTERDVKLVVHDNGRGIIGEPKPLGGLSGLMWRAAELGGACSVSPVEPSGTRLSWSVPV